MSDFDRRNPNKYSNANRRAGSNGSYSNDGRRPAAPRNERGYGGRPAGNPGASPRSHSGRTGSTRPVAGHSGSTRRVNGATGSYRPVSRDAGATGRIYDESRRNGRASSSEREAYPRSESRSGRRSGGARHGSHSPVQQPARNSNVPRKNGNGDAFSLIAGFFKSALSTASAFLASIAKRSKVAFAAIVIVAVMLVGGAVDSLANVGKVYSRVTVGDVKARGMTEEELAQAIKDEYEPRVTASDVTIYRSEDAMSQHAENPDDSGNLSVEEQAAQTNYWTANWESLQAQIDYEKLASEAFQAGRGGFLDRLGVFFFGRNIPVEVQFSDASLESLASNIDLALGNAYKNSEVTIENGKAKASVSEPGMMIDREEFREKLSDQFSSKDAQNREFYEEVVETEPQITTEEGQETADRINAAIANGAKFSYNKSTWTVDSAELGSWVDTHIVTEDNGDAKLVAYFDPKLASSDISEHAKAIFPDGNDGIRFEAKGNGEVVVKLDSEGTMPQINSSVSNLNDQLLGDNANVDSVPTIEVQSVKVPSEMSFNEALNANVISLISEYTTEFTAGAEERNHNIHLAGEKINNSVIKADGGIWSFHETVGESNEANGFESAGSIVAGEMSEEYGGGICLVATTVFNAVYDSGLPVTERRNHSMYISSYPEGRDAAVSWPDLDLKWENDTSSDILLKTSSTDTSLTVCLYGVNPGYTVETQTGEWTDSTEYDKVIKYDSEVAPGTSYVKTAGSNGHTISVIRTVTDKKGEKVREDNFVSVYEPTDEVTVRGGTSADWPSAS